MDRIIKFRGKRIDNNKWIYGDLLQPTEFDNIYEISDNGCIDGTRYEVNPKTIGQFTGLYDKNEKEIYTSDIVKITEKENISKHKIIPMRPIIAEIAWSDEYLAYILITISIKDAFENLGEYLDYEIEVIGNVWENIELLKEE